MSKFSDFLHGFFTKQTLLPPGIYTYHTSPEASTQYRLHLRVDPDSEGILIVNASSVLHLNQTGTEIAYELVKGTPLEEIVNSIYKRFDAPKEVIDQDVRSFESKLQDLLKNTDQDPVSDFGFEPHQKMEDLSAPYRLDCCLTLKEEISETSTETAKGLELDTQQWKQILEKAFRAGIPQVIFTGGEPTQRPDLVELVRYTEELGLVLGLMSSGMSLGDETYLNALIAAGLDHLIYPYEPSDNRQTLALEKILPLDLYTCVALDIKNEVGYELIIDRLIAEGVNAFAISPAYPEAHERSHAVSDYVQSKGIKLITDIPLSQKSLLALAESDTPSQSIKGEDYIQLRLAPNGEVFPAFKREPGMGNLLNESWEDIWGRRILS